jgi:hypothetical protein
MLQVPRDKKKRELNVVPKRKSLFKETIDESQQRLGGGKYTINGDKTRTSIERDAQLCSSRSQSSSYDELTLNNADLGF